MYVSTFLTGVDPEWEDILVRVVLTSGFVQLLFVNIVLVPLTISFPQVP